MQYAFWNYQKFLLFFQAEQNAEHLNQKEYQTHFQAWNQVDQQQKINVRIVLFR